MEVEAPLDAALIVLESGGSTRLAESTLNNIRKAYSHADAAPERADSIWRSDFVALSISARETLMRRVGTLGFSLFRASEAASLGERAARGEIDSSAIAGEINRIRRLPAPYTREITILAAACAAGFFTQTAGGDFGAFGVAFVAAAVGQFVRSIPQLRKLTRAVNILMAATVSAFIGTAGLRLGLSAVAPATLLGSIIYMVPGLSLANGFVDLVSDRHMLVGVERLLNAGFTFLILALALVAADALL